MKTKQIFTVLTILSLVLFASMSRAAWITAINSGSWGDTNVWDSGTVPGTNDFAEIDPGYNITVDTNAIVQYIIGNGAAGGTVTMAANSTLEILDSSVSGTFELGLLDASASGNTVIYYDNPFYAKRQNYYNLVFNNTTTNLNDFFNGLVSSQIPATAMTIAGDMTVIGKTKVQQGDDFTINGNLILTSNASWDCSSFNLTVKSNLTLGAGALMVDLDGALGSNYFGGNVIVTSSALGWNLTDVTTWGIGGSLTNDGTIVGRGYGSIFFNGTGNIVGKSFKIPTMTINGTYAIGATITLSTNTQTINGTVVFDIARTNQIVLNAGTNWLWYTTNGTLNVINSGAEPAVGNSFQLFKASNNHYGGGFASISLPPLSGGHIWVDNLLASGSIAVANGSAGSPIITLSRSGSNLTLSWDSATFSGYEVLALTNSAGVITNLSHSWLPTGSGTNSPFTIAINPTNPAVFFRLRNP
jgi:hypothetical protein